MCVCICVSLCLCVQFYWDSFTETDCRENKLDTGEDNKPENDKGVRRLEHIAKLSMKPSRAIQAEAKRSQLAWKIRLYED